MSDRCDFVDRRACPGEDGRLPPRHAGDLPAIGKIVIDCKAASMPSSTPLRPRMRTREKFVLGVTRSKFARASAIFHRKLTVAVSAESGIRLMFLPGEAFLYAASSRMRADRDALKSRVILARRRRSSRCSRRSNFGWRQEEITQTPKNPQARQGLCTTVSRRLRRISQNSRSIDAAARIQHALASLNRACS